MKLLLIGLVCVLLFVIAFIRYLEETSVFYPDHIVNQSPTDIGLDYKDVYIETPDRIRLHGWLIPARQATTTILFMHGNAGNVGDRLSTIQLLHGLGADVLIFDYRGYGKSTGLPSERGVYMDALAAYDYLVKHLPAEHKVVAYGASLGGAVAIHLAANRPIDGLIVNSSFTSAKDMAKILYPFIPSFIVSNRFNSASKVSNLHMPKLFIHSPQDEVVPVSLGQKLFDLAPQPKIFLEIRGTHNDGYLADRVDALKDFINGISHRK